MDELWVGGMSDDRFWPARRVIRVCILVLDLRGHSQDRICLALIAFTGFSLEATSKLPRYHPSTLLARFDRARWRPQRNRTMRRARPTAAGPGASVLRA